MTQDVSLRVQFSDLATMHSAIMKTHEQLHSRLEQLRWQVRSDLAGWDGTTASRQAQQDFESQLTADIARLITALHAIGAVVATISEAAHATEVRNVAILD